MESTENVYYTGTSEIIGEDNTWGIEDVVIVENENLNWQEEGPEITVDYDDACENQDNTLNENDIYLSTNADDSNEAEKTEYYSILETTTYQEADDFGENNVTASIVVNVNDNNEMILPHGTNDYDDSEIIKETNEDENLDNQVILYSSDDPNEMYAVQIADDGNGNFQRYKYKVRPTADGQLEAIPGTIEVQDANIDDVMQTNKTVNQTENAVCAQEESDAADEITLQGNQTAENNQSIKEEPADENSLDASDMDEEYGTPEYLLSENEFDNEEYLVTRTKADQNELQLQQNNYLEITPDIEEENSNLTSFNETFIKVSEKKRKFFKSRESNLTSQLCNLKNNKHENEITVYKGDKKVSYLIVDSIEKENMELAELNNIASNMKNSRSILKNSFLIPVEDYKKNNKTAIRMLNNNKNIEIKESGKVIKDKSEPAEQVVVGENKIADKSVRQPRKQTIKPVERFGSEIVVQPMYYSVNEENNGVEFVPKKRKYTRTSVEEVVKVSDDSDPDYTDNPKPKKRKSIGKKKLKHKKIAHITISDSEQSSDEESVIEVLTDETDNSKLHIEYLDSDFDEQTTNDLDKSDDITKIQEAVDHIVQEREERQNKTEKENSQINKDKINNVTEGDKKIIVKKNNIKCPICPKTFPREINLKNHMNIHNARRSLRSKPIEKTEPKTVNKEKVSAATPRKLDKFYCAICKLKFLSDSQLKRHQTVHRDRKVPGITPKKLQILRKSNAISPLKLRRTKSKAIIPERTKLNLPIRKIDSKNVMMSPRRPFKCDQCAMSFSHRSLLTAHKLLHKQFFCIKCNIKFTSKLLLDDHSKKKCGKVEQSKRKSKTISPPKPTSRISQLFLNCTNCKERFRTVEQLNQHVAKEHKKKVGRVRRPHGGVPVSSKMQRAFDLMKLKS